MHYSIPPLTKPRPTHPYTLPGSAPVSSLAKAALVTALGFILAWKPRLAAYLGKFICACWRRFPEA